MKKYICLLTFALICILAAGCNRVSGNPREDADKMADELIEVAHDYDAKKVDKIVGKYVKYYENAPLRDRVKFIRRFRDNKKLEDNSAFERMTEKESFKECPAVEDMDDLFKTTRKEAVEADIWNE